MTDKPHHPLTIDGEPRAFFGRRSGKRLHKGQERLFQDLLPTIEIAYPETTLEP
ncbi:MAG: tRNA (guanosine(46)-N7)-methyltransferase TrmB, partial [Alphaproteobacteria bacterium]